MMNGVRPFLKIKGAFKFNGITGNSYAAVRALGWSFGKITMKVLWFVLFAGAMYLTSCKKNSGAGIKSDSITGSWELRSTSGGMVPGSTVYPQGNGNVFKFNDSLYEKYTDGMLVSSGKFTLLPDPTVEETVYLVVEEGEYSNRIVYDGKLDSEKVFIQIRGNKLSLLSGNYALDYGHHEEYTRLGYDY